MSCKHEFWTLRNQPSICMECGKTRREIELEAQNKLMREALEYYADEYAWKSTNSYGANIMGYAYTDKGKKAKAALEVNP